MFDLNDLAAFAAVAEHGGYAATERALGAPRSRLSWRVAALERQLGVRLIHRTSRRFALTETGQAVLRHAQVMLAEAQAAHAIAAGGASALSRCPRLHGWRDHQTVRLSHPVHTAFESV